MLLADKKHIATTTLPHQIWSDSGTPLPVIINNVNLILIPITTAPERRRDTRQTFFGIDSKGDFYDVEIHRAKDTITVFRKIWNVGLILKANTNDQNSALRCKLLTASYLKHSSDVKEIYDYALTKTYTPFDELYKVVDLANMAADVTPENCGFNKTFTIQE